MKLSRENVAPMAMPRVIPQSYALSACEQSISISLYEWRAAALPACWRPLTTCTGALVHLKGRCCEGGGHQVTAAIRHLADLRLPNDRTASPRDKKPLLQHT